MEEGLCPCWTPDNVTENLHGRMIYKDECCRSFNTPRDPGGIDVCLRTFVGHANPPDVPEEENFSLIHYKNTGNPLVMNIREVPKADGQPVKITKLAIGKPGGIDADADKYATRRAEERRVGTE